MRYGLLEFFFEQGKPVFQWAARDLCFSSAHDARRAWNYQASFKGGYMEVIEDTEEAFEAERQKILKFHPRCSEAY